MDWFKILETVVHGAPDIPIVTGFARCIPDCIARADLSTHLRQAHFIAQCAHESADFRFVVEIWGPTEAQRHYEGRMGNVHPGDGERFKGRGLIQLTGRANYRRFGARLGLDLEKDPDKAAQFPWAALVAAEYWKERGINRFADHDDIRGVTRVVNGGLNGLADRALYLARAKRALGI